MADGVAILCPFALVWIANQYMSIYNRLRLNIKHEHPAIEAEQKEKEDESVTLRNAA
jgi:hypothetical protein